jgi:hypothetical protein
MFQVATVTGIKGLEHRAGEKKRRPVGGPDAFALLLRFAPGGETGAYHCQATSERGQIGRFLSGSGYYRLNKSEPLRFQWPEGKLFVNMAVKFS